MAPIRASHMAWMPGEDAAGRVSADDPHGAPRAEGPDETAPTGGDAAARPLAALDAALEGICALPPTALDRPGMALGPGICVQYRGASGVRAEAEGLGPPAPGDMTAPDPPPLSTGLPSGGLRLALLDRGDSPWFSLELALPMAPLRRARFLGLRLHAAADAGVAALRPVLRLHHEDGWQDAGFGRDMAFTPTPSEQLLALSLDRLTGRAQARDATLILFLRQRAATLRLARIEPFLGG